MYVTGSLQQLIVIATAYNDEQFVGTVVVDGPLQGKLFQHTPVPPF